MKSAGMHPFENERLAALFDLNVLDTGRESVFDNIAELAALICHTPIALVTLVDGTRQWFKAVVGLTAQETSRDVAFCAHAILGSEPLIVEDALADERFHDNPLVTGEPGIRFYAGSPLVTHSGLPLGTLCAIDRVPRTLTPGQRRALDILSTQVVAHLEIRKMIATLEKETRAHLEESSSILRSLAALAHDLRAPFSSIIGLTELLAEDLSILDKDEILKCILDLRRAGYAGIQMLENLLDISLFKGGMRKPEPKNVHLEHLLRKVLSTVSGMAAGKRIGIDLAGSEPVVLLADPWMASSIFQNMLSNAIKFTPTGGKILVSCQRVPGAVSVRVQDSGVGMDQATVDRLNAGEAIASSHGTSGEKGMGLGLKLCREFCQASQATLVFASTHGQGTSCTVTFPVPPASG